MLPRFVDYPIDPVTTTMLQTPFLTDWTLEPRLRARAIRWAFSRYGLALVVQ